MVSDGTPIDDAERLLWNELRAFTPDGPPVIEPDGKGRPARIAALESAIAAARAAHRPRRARRATPQDEALLW